VRTVDDGFRAIAAKQKIAAWCIKEREKKGGQQDPPDRVRYLSKFAKGALTQHPSLKTGNCMILIRRKNSTKLFMRGEATWVGLPVINLRAVPEFGEGPDKGSKGNTRD